MKELTQSELNQSELGQLIITKLDPPVLVYSKKGETFEMIDRPSCGLSFCINGQITYIMDGKQYVSKPNTAVILPQGASYTLIRDKEGLFPLLNFQCENYNNQSIQVLDLQDPKSCLQKFEALQKMFLHDTMHLKILSTFYDLLHTVCEGSRPTLPMLQTAIQYFDENISDPNLSNDSLAAHLGISEVYLRKLFNRYYQTTPRQYLLSRRIQKAMYMLVNTSYSVTDISAACGFSSLYHFCRTFKQRTGQTPTEYADKNRYYEI